MTLGEKILARQWSSILPGGSRRPAVKPGDEGFV